MNTIKQSAIFVAVAALAPLAAQAEMVELSDAELRAVQGQGPISGLREALQNYRSELEPLWTELTTVQGISPPLHYVGWSAVLAGYAISGPAGAALTAFANTPLSRSIDSAWWLNQWHSSEPVSASPAFICSI